MSGLRVVGRSFSTMPLSEQDILQTLMHARGRISAAAWVVVRDAHAAEDIFQNVALKALTKPVSFAGEGPLLSWAFVSARWEAIDWIKRLADGREVEVPAGRQVVASATADTELRVDGRPGSVDTWQSDLHADLRHGTPGAGGRAQTAPLLWRTPTGSNLLHLVALSASRGWSAPVLLTPGSIFRIRGRVDDPGTVYFGLTTHNLNGTFSGKFQYAHTFQPTSESDKEFDLALDVDLFLPKHETADGTATKKLASRPEGLGLVDWWCCTVDKDSGLTITGVELIPARPQSASFPEGAAR